jgi:hypothetical protein
LHGEWFNSKIVYELEDVLNEYENKWIKRTSIKY